MNLDPEFRKLLHSWKAEPPPDPRFAASVWSRIEARRAEREAGVSIWQWLLGWQLSWRAALAALAVMIGAGGAIGVVAASRSNARTSAALEARYVDSMDPFIRVAQRAMP